MPILKTVPSRFGFRSVAISAALLMNVFVVLPAMAASPTPGEELFVPTVAASTGQAVHAPTAIGATGATGVMYV